MKLICIEKHKFKVCLKCNLINILYLDIIHIEPNNNLLLAKISLHLYLVYIASSILVLSTTKMLVLKCSFVVVDMSLLYRQPLSACEMKHI
jgi:hypothetical protein